MSVICHKVVLDALPGGALCWFLDILTSEAILPALQEPGEESVTRQKRKHAQRSTGACTAAGDVKTRNQLQDT